MAQPVPSALVDAARCGSSLEIEQLLQAAWPVAYRLAYSVLGDRESAQDAAQESCVILYRTIASLRDPAAFRAWFYRIVVREASSLKRRHVELNVRKEPAQQIADRTTAFDVWRALSILPQHLRDVIVLRYFEDLPSREIASILRINDGAVRFRLMVARRRLRPLLGDLFETSSDSTTEVTTNAI
ncbi:MAG: sigma-70 family RNA polymerase sigma factor [Candidatus Cybelea sp.]